MHIALMHIACRANVFPRMKADVTMPNSMNRVLILFVRRLALPGAVFAGFALLCVRVYMHLEGLRWQDALFWMFHPHAIEYTQVRDATKFFAIFVFLVVFAFQVWVAERVLATIFSRHGMEAWRSMVNDINIETVKDHFIVCGYGQVGRTVVDQLKRMKIPFVLIETNDGLYRELVKEGFMVIQGDAQRHDILETAGIKRARGVCVVIDNDAANLYITVTAKSLNPKAKIITRAGQQRYAQAMRNSGADEVIIPEYEGGLMTGRMIEKYYPASMSDR
jgi:voltage-gated potassium channel